MHTEGRIYQELCVARLIRVVFSGTICQGTPKVYLQADATDENILQMASLHFEQYTGKLLEISTNEIESRRAHGLIRFLTACRSAALLTHKVKEDGSAEKALCDMAITMASALAKERDALKLWVSSQTDEISLLHGWYADLSVLDKASRRV